MNNDFDAKKNKQAVKCLTIGHFVVDSYSGFLAPILPFIASKIGISLTLAGSVISISHLLSSIIQPFFGFLADKIKKRFFIFWGMLLACVFLSMTGIAQNYWQLVLFLVLGSIGSGFYHPQSTGFINYFSSKDISKNMAIFIAMGTIGYSMGPLISSAITASFSLEALPFMAIFGIITAICIFKFVPQVSIIPVLKPIPKTNFAEATKLIFANKTLVILIIISMLKSLIAQSYCIYMPFLWKDMGYSVSNIGIALFLFSFTGGVATYLSSKIEHKIGHKNVFYISMISVMPLTFLYAFTYKNMPLVSLILFVTVGFVTMLSTSVNMTLAQNLMKEYKSMISGYIGGFSWGVTGALFFPLSFLAEKIGIIHLLILVSIISFICSYWVKFLPEKEV
jgi:FSR family fosmidomycin resistance protein-like MFS transporter